MPDCASMPMDFCGMCLCDFCEGEIAACVDDPTCICYVDCHAEGSAVDECMMLCGDSATRESLWACTVGLCGDMCLFV